MNNNPLHDLRNACLDLSNNAFNRALFVLVDTFYDIANHSEPGTVLTVEDNGFRLTLTSTGVKVTNIATNTDLGTVSVLPL